MAKRLSGLGRGLDAIFSDVERAYENNITPTQTVFQLNISKIRSNPFQPRGSFSDESLKELSESILEHGLLQPILVYREGDGYTLIAGERRLRASKMAGQQSIRAIVVDIDVHKLHELALIENIQREDLNPIDLAKAYKKLIQDHGITHQELARRIKKSRPQISNTLRLLSLIPEVQEALKQEEITQGHAKVLVGFSAEKQRSLLDDIIKKRLNVIDTEGLAKNMREQITAFSSTESKNIVNRDLNIEVAKLGTLLRSKGMKASAKSNRLAIDFQNLQEIKLFFLIFKE